MSGELTFPKFAVFALIVGAIGAFGQAYLLYHELADCLPYKVVDADFYWLIARTGMWLAPLIAVFAGTMFIRKQFLFLLILPVLLTPLLFAGIFWAFNVADGFNMSADSNAFGDFTTARAAEQFFAYCFSLATTGFTIGTILALLIWLLVRPKKLA